MHLSDADIARAFIGAGLLRLGRAERPLVSATPDGLSPASCGPEHGRFDSAGVDCDSPELAVRLNAEWFRMAVEYGLFGDDREFLVAVHHHRDSGDVTGTTFERVRLLDRWDLVAGNIAFFGSGMAGLFTDRYVPEFSSFSLDGRAEIQTTVWGNGTVGVIAVRPDRLIHPVRAG